MLTATKVFARAAASSQNLNTLAQAREAFTACLALLPILRVGRAPTSISLTPSSRTRPCKCRRYVCALLSAVLAGVNTCARAQDDPMRADIQRCPIRKGSLLIWSSYTPHGNYPNDSADPRMIQVRKPLQGEVRDSEYDAAITAVVHQGRAVLRPLLRTLLQRGSAARGIRAHAAGPPGARLRPLGGSGGG